MKTYILNGRNLTEYPEGLEVNILSFTEDGLPIIEPTHINHQMLYPSVQLTTCETLSPAEPKLGEVYLYEGQPAVVVGEVRNGFVLVGLLHDMSGKEFYVNQKELSVNG